MDTSLSDDLVKLVRYSIISIERDKERMIHRGEKIVTDNLSDDAFASWMIASYLQSEEYGALKPEHRIKHDEKKYLRVSHEVLGRWPKQDRKYEQRQLDVLGDIRDAIHDLRRNGGQKPGGQQTGEQKPPQPQGSTGLLDYLKDTFSDKGHAAAAKDDPYYEFLNRLELSRATFDDWREGFRHCAGPLSEEIAKIFNQYRKLGHLEGPEVDADKLEEAFRNPMRFHPHLLEMFEGPARGNLRVYRPDPSDPSKQPEEIQAPPVQSVWGDVDKVGEIYIQRITGSNFEYIPHHSPHLKKRLEEVKVDLTLNMFTPDLGIVSWSVFYQNHSNQMRSIGYKLGDNQLLWVNELLFQNMKPTVPNQLILSVDFEKEIDGQRRFCVYAMHLNFNFSTCEVEFAGPILKLINEPVTV